MQTAWFLLVLFLTPLFMGLPLALLLSRSDDSQEFRWGFSFLLGIGVIVLMAQNAIYLNLPISRTIYALIFVGFIGWIALWRSVSLPKLFPVPKGLLLIGALTFIVHASGLFYCGIDRYVGRAWHDQYNYVSVSEFLSDFRFDTDVTGIQLKPYVMKGMEIKKDRIGQSVLHGALTRLSGLDSKVTFGPIIIFFTFLIPIVVYLLCLSLALTPTIAAIAALLSGALPALAFIHLECFLSQSLGIPFLLAWPIAANRATKTFDSRSILSAGILFAAGVSIYTEFFLLYVAILLLSGIPTSFRGANLVRNAYRIFALLSVGLLLNFGFIPGILLILKRVNINVLTGIYPWAYSLEGFTRLFFGELPSYSASPAIASIGILSVGIVLSAYVGFALALFKRKDALGYQLFFLASLAWISRVLHPENTYQYYKILLSISPLIPLGIAILYRLLQQGTGSKKLIAGTAAMLALFSMTATASLGLRAAGFFGLDRTGRGGAKFLLDPAFLDLQKFLNAHQNQNVVLSWFDDLHLGGYMNAWIAFLARHDTVWFSNKVISDVNIEEAFHPVFTLPTPNHFLFVTEMAMSPLVGGSDAVLVFSEGRYRVYECFGKNWYVPYKIGDEPNGFTILSGANINASLSGQTDPFVEKVALKQVVNDTHFTAENTAHGRQDKDFLIPFELREGSNRLTLEARPRDNTEATSRLQHLRLVSQTLSQSIGPRH